MAVLGGGKKKNDRTQKLEQWKMEQANARESKPLASSPSIPNRKSYRSRR